MADKDVYETLKDICDKAIEDCYGKYPMDRLKILESAMTNFLKKYCMMENYTTC